MFTPRWGRALAVACLSLIPPSLASAAPEWEILFASSALDEVKALTVAPDGSIYAAGRANANFLTLKITSTGSVVWNRIYDAGSSDFAHGVAIDTSGYVYAGGNGAGSGSAQDIVWAKYTSTGGLAGTLRYDSGAVDYLRGLAIGPDGNIVMGGDGDGNLRVIKFSPNGNILWNTIYDSGSADSAYRMALDRHGNVLLAGGIYTSNTISQTVKVSSNGVVQWARTYVSTGPDEGRGIAADQYDNVYVGGYRGYGAGETGYSATLLKYDSAGTLLWAKSHQNAADSGTGGDVGTTLGVDAMGNPVLAGQGGNDERIWRFDPFGTLLNDILYPSGGLAKQFHFLKPYPTGGFLAGGYCCLKAWVFKDSFPSLKSPPGVPGSPFTAVSAVAVTASWTANGNSANTAYRLDLSTASNFSGTLYSSTTLGVSAGVTGLSAGVVYYARVATTADGVFTALGSTATLAVSGTLSTAPISNVQVSSLTANWSSTHPGGTLYYAQLSTNASFTPLLTSSTTVSFSATFASLNSNTTYYAQVATAPSGPFTSLGSTATWIQAPTSVYIDEVTSHSIVASAYSPTPAFSNLNAGLSGTNVARDGVYAGWHGESWTSKAAMPTARYAYSAAALDGMFYAPGGYTSGVLATHVRYDPAANAWTTRTSLPVGRDAHVTLALGGLVYAIGGETSVAMSSAVTAYDPAGNAWTNRSSFPLSDTALSGAVLAGKLHGYGGSNGSNLVNHYAYDVDLNSWTPRASMPSPRQAMMTGVVAGKAYVLGGHNVSTLSANVEYDPSLDTWTVKAPMPTGRYYHMGAAVGGKVYALGGESPAVSPVNEEYDPAADAWTTRAPMPTARTRAGVAVIGGRLYVAGGANGAALSTHEVYDPGVAQQFVGLQPNTQYTFKAKARNLAGIETGETSNFSTYTLAAVPGAFAFSFVGASSASLQWTVAGNPGGTEFQAALAVSSSFASASTTAWTADMVSAVFSGLSAGTTYFGRVRARNAVGVPTDYAATLSTRARLADIPGCAVSLFVLKDGSGHCTRIQACVDLVPSTPFTGDVCIQVQDAGVYSERLMVQGKDPRDFRLRVMGASTRTRLIPPAGSNAGIHVFNSSVTVTNIAVVSTNAISYGILVSSPLVTLSSVSVDAGGLIASAGIQMSSGVTVSYASVTVSIPHAVAIYGSGNAISFTSASVKNFAVAAFYFLGASSNTLTDSVGYGNPGYGAFLNRSHGNVLARNDLRKISGADGSAGLWLANASSNVVRDSAIGSNAGYAAELALEAHGNLIERSTITNTGVVYEGLLVNHGRGNRVSRVYASARGNGASFASGASQSIVEHSTFTSSDGGFRAFGTNGSSETITDLLLTAPNGTALGIFGSSITVSGIRGFSATSAHPSLYIAGGGNISIRDSSFENGGGGDGAKLERTSWVELSHSTITGGFGATGLKLEGASSNTVTASRLAAAGGIGLAVGSYLELFDMTTTTGTGNAFSGLDVSASTAVSLGAAPGLNLSSSVLTGDAQGAAIVFRDAVLVATFTALAFPSGAALSADAALLPGGSRITIRDASGPQAGSLYENDPMSRVDWVPDLVPFVLPPAPAAPSGIVLGTSSIAWTWAAVVNAQTYRVYSSSSGSLLAASVSTGVVLTGLLPAATHSVVVAGIARGENGPLSPSATAHTHAAPPGGLALTRLSASSATLSWSLNENPPGTFAELQRSTDAAAFSVRGGTRATTADDMGLLGCTSYYYRVRNRNPVGLDSAFEGPLFVRTPASTPSAPGDLSAQSVPGRRVALTWNPSATEGIVAYRLYKDTGAGAVDYSSAYAQFSGTTFSTATVALSSGAIHLFGLRAVHRCGTEETNTHAVASAWALETLDGVRASIKVPATGKKISGNRVLVMAELDTGSSNDVSSILFQYRSTGSSVWTDIPAANANHPNPDREQPFFVHWDVSALADRAYDLRAVASDVLGASDPAPGTITVLVDSVGFEVKETDLGGGKVKKEQAVSNETSNTIATAESGSAVVTKVVLPAGALNTADATLSATANPPALPPPPAAATSLGASIEITLSNGQSQLSNGQTAAIVFNYPDDNGDGVIDGTQVRAENAEIQTFDVPTNNWKREFATVVDKDKKTLTGQTPHFSLFAAFGVLGANLDAIRAYPNPYKPNGGNADEGRPFSRADPLSGVIFDNLPTVVTIKIYTLTGRLVSEFGTSAGTGALQWDGKNDQGEDVASGGYFAVITSPGASPLVKKIGVIR